MKRLRPSLIILVAAVVLGRAALPVAVKMGANWYLGHNASFNGHVGDVDIALLRGAYQVEDLNLARREPARSPAFFTAKRVDISVDWKELLHGRLLAEGRIENPVIDTGYLPVKKPDEDVRRKAEAAVPMKISELKISDGVIRFPARPGSSAGVFEIRKLAVTAQDLRVTEDPSNKTETTVRATAETPGNGRLAVNVRYDPFSRPVKFDLDAAIEDVELKQLNPVLRSTADIDVEAGKGSVYAEARAAGGEFNGYVKPLIKDLNVLDARKEKESSMGQKIKEGLSDVVGSIFKNREKRTVGARVPFSGTFEDPKVGVWTAVGTVLRNAFVQALAPRIENRF